MIEVHSSLDVRIQDPNTSPFRYLSRTCQTVSLSFMNQTVCFSLYFRLLGVSDSEPIVCVRDVCIGFARLVTHL